MSNTWFTWMTWLKSTELLWIFTSIKTGESKCKKSDWLFFFLLFISYVDSIWFLFFGTLKQMQKMNRNVKTLEKKQDRKRIFMKWWAESWAGSSRVGPVSGQIPYAGSSQFSAIFETDASCYMSQRKPGTTQLAVKEACTTTRHHLNSPDTQSPEN